MQYHREFLLGRWFRQDTDEHNRKVIEYAEFSADGSFEFTFVILAITVDKKEQIIEQITELGDWGLVAILNTAIAEKKAPLSQIKVLSFKEKGEWDLQAKYNIGKKAEPETTTEPESVIEETTEEPTEETIEEPEDGSTEV